MIDQKIKIIPLEVVLRNTAYGSLCKQTTIKTGTILESLLINVYLNNENFNEPLLTKERINLLKIVYDE